MDNSNNSNSSNNPTPNPVLPVGPLSPSPSDTGATYQPTWAPSLTTPVQSESIPTPAPLPSGTGPVWSTEPTVSGQIATDFPAPGPSPLDNPWGAPVQPPPIDGPTPSAQPTWAPSPTGNTISMDQTLSTSPAESAQLPSEPAPTDLSHLISNNSQSDNGQNSSSASPETLVVPSTPSSVPEVPVITTEGHKGIPKWLIGVGMGLLIIVAGVSAYFILGIGQPPKATTSIPAEVSKTTVKTPPPIATPAPQANPAATGSANFGELEGNQTPQATSAADLLKQRQAR